MKIDYVDGEVRRLQARTPRWHAPFSGDCRGYACAPLNTSRGAPVEVDGETANPLDFAELIADTEVFLTGEGVRHWIQRR